MLIGLVNLLGENNEVVSIFFLKIGERRGVRVKKGKEWENRGRNVKL